MDISHKVVRKDSILSMIRKIYVNNEGKSKDEKRRMVSDLSRGKIVLAHYGNQRYYKVTDVIFDRDIS